MNLYVSNLDFQVTDQRLKSVFERFGQVNSVNIITDKATGKPRGFAFVEMDDNAAEKAMQELEGTQLEGRMISVSKARPKSDNNRGGYSSGRDGYRF